MNSKNIITGKLDCFLLNSMTSNNHAVITARKRSFGQYFYTCLSFCSQTGGSTSVHSGKPPLPGAGTCPGPCTTSPSEAAPPPGAGLPLDQAPPPREQGPPARSRPPASAEHAGRYGQCAGGTHPTGMQSCRRYIFTSTVKVDVFDRVFLMDLNSMCKRIQPISKR